MALESIKSREAVPVLAKMLTLPGMRYHSIGCNDSNPITVIAGLTRNLLQHQMENV